MPLFLLLLSLHYLDFFVFVWIKHFMLKFIAVEEFKVIEKSFFL